MTEIHPGSILLCTEVYSAVGPPSSDNPNRATAPVWARVARCVEDKIFVDWLSQPVTDKAGVNICYLCARFDRFKVVPEDDVPDWVWAAVAKRTLLGEVNEWQ